MHQRFAIINADDFGLSTAVNGSVFQAHDQGILTSTSLMVTGAAVAAAVDYAHAHPTLGVGLHLVVIKGRAALPSNHIPNLVDEDGEFGRDPLQVGLGYQFNRAARRELRREIRAQLELFRQTGLPLSHVDGHKHLHCHPVVLNILLDLAPEFGIPIIRLPWEELQLTLEIDRQNILSKALHWWIFGQLHRYALPRLQAAGVGTSERVYGLLQSGKMTEDYLLALIPKIQARKVEIYCHPACPEPGSKSYGSTAELHALLSAPVRQALDKAGFELVNFHQWMKLSAG
jgi:hopanoid biosynthesis associated protein HpnK